MARAGGETPAMRQYWEAKRQHPDALLLFRMGDFFEVFFDDAREAAPIMGVALTSRPMQGGRQPMCGVPHHAWESYVGKLLRAGKKVVLCDQMEQPNGRTVVRREVTRVLTPGTVLEDAYLEPDRSNWLVAAVSRGAEAGLASCDISTGELQLCQLPAERLPAELSRLRPAELLTTPPLEAYRFDPERGRQRLRDLLGITVVESIGAEAAPLAIGAAGVVLDYLRENQVQVVPGLLRVASYWPETTMQLDEATVRNLELDQLIRLVDRSTTPIGARRIRRWLRAPLRETEEIELRLGATEELGGPIGSILREALRGVADLERLVTRAAQGLSGPRELAALRRSLEALPEVRQEAEAASSLAVRRRAAAVEGAPEVADELRRALVDEPPAILREGGGAIRDGYDADLDRIKEASRGSREWLTALEARERERTGIKSLKVGYNRVFGYYLEISHANRQAVPDDYERKQTLSTGERYLTPELKTHEALVLGAQQDCLRREQELLAQLSRRVQEAAPQLLRAAEAVGELDALSAFAAAAVDYGWSRPEISQGLELSIRGGRHPIVEQAVALGEFVANDTHLACDRDQIVILTGPNMAGKSTYLRQVALIVLLAQCGSFVPAEQASIGLTDRVFTRVGAHDDLAAGMSTFMVEMAETANILNHATRSSLVVFDEVGRGTSTYDGLSIAQAVVETIHDSPRLGCRTLFATHFHELTALADRLPRVRNQRVEVQEEGDTIRFLHRVVPGGADRSYGIHVAALAGLPGPLIARARQLLAQLESERPLEPPEQQLGLPLIAAEDPLRKRLRDVDPNRLTPLDALQTLFDLHQEVEE